MAVLISVGGTACLMKQAYLYCPDPGISCNRLPLQLPNKHLNMWIKSAESTCFGCQLAGVLHIDPIQKFSGLLARPEFVPDL